MRASHAQLRVLRALDEGSTLHWTVVGPYLKPGGDTVHYSVARALARRKWIVPVCPETAYDHFRLTPEGRRQLLEASKLCIPGTWSKPLIRAYRRGYASALLGEDSGMCPYDDKRKPSGKLSWSRAFMNAWHDGWLLGKQGRS